MLFDHSRVSAVRYSGRADGMTSTSCISVYDQRFNARSGSMLSKKSFRGNKRTFSELLMRFRAQGREGPPRFSEKRPRTFVSALLSIAAAEWCENQHLRDFWPRSIFDFFDSIGQNRKWRPADSMSAPPSTADITHWQRDVRKVPTD